MIHDREDAASWPDYGRDYCIVCGRPHPNLHHMPPIGSGRRSEWSGALLALCGSGVRGLGRDGDGLQVPGGRRRRA